MIRPPVFVELGGFHVQLVYYCEFQGVTPVRNDLAQFLQSVVLEIVVELFRFGNVEDVLQRNNSGRRMLNPGLTSALVNQRHIIQ